MCHAKSKSFHRVEFLDRGPDALGRRIFFGFWMADYHPGDPRGENKRAERGQIFFSNPGKYLISAGGKPAVPTRKPTNPVSGHVDHPRA
jgi:hypothetical protein